MDEERGHGEEEDDANSGVSLGGRVVEHGAPGGDGVGGVRVGCCGGSGRDRVVGDVCCCCCSWSCAWELCGSLAHAVVAVDLSCSKRMDRRFAL